MWAAALSALLSGGCGLLLDLDPPDDVVDASVSDGGRMDAGPVDAGPVDAGPLDAGPFDAGPFDAGDGGCADDDMDGQTVCDGDCDDTDPAVFRGAPLDCTDGVVNACPSDPVEDPECDGLFVAQTEAADDGNPGTPESPLRTVGAALDRAAGAGHIYVATGTYNESPIVITGTVFLEGGFDPDTWRDSGSRSELRVAQSVAVNPGATDAGMAGFVVRADTVLAGPTVFIHQDAVFDLADCEALGQAVETTARAAVQVGTGTVGSGLARIVDCDIRLGRGREGASSRGVWVRQTLAEVEDNRFYLSDTGDQSGVILDRTPGEALVAGNQFFPGTGRLMSGIQVFLGGGRLEGNLIDPGTASLDNAGIFLNRPRADLLIENNIAFSGDGASRSAAALYINVDPVPPASALVVNSNTFVAMQFTPTAVALYLQPAGAPAASAEDRLYGDITNNLLWGGLEWAVREFDPFSSIGDPEVGFERFEHNALSIRGASEQVYEDDVGPSLSVADLAAGNVPSDCGIRPYDTPSDLGLPPGSACVDQGVVPTPSVDFEGDARPQGAGPDIGADEQL